MCIFVLNNFINCNVVDLGFHQVNRMKNNSFGNIPDFHFRRIKWVNDLDSSVVWFVRVEWIWNQTKLECTQHFNEIPSVDKETIELMYATWTKRCGYPSMFFFRFANTLQNHSSYKKAELQEHHHLNIIIILTKKSNLCSLEPHNLNWICFTFTCKYIMQ